MSREKKDSKNLNIKIDRVLSDRLEEYCRELGQTKTTAIERILAKHLDEYELSLSSDAKQHAAE